MVRYFFLAALVLLLTSCPPPLVITDPGTTTPLPEVAGQAHFDYWIHAPLHPGNLQPVSFQVKAEDPAGISRVDLAVYEYELFTNQLGLPSKRRRSNGIWGIVNTWNLNTPVSNFAQNFTLTDGFPAHSNVEYIFSVTNLKGEVSRQMALFDAGDSPWPQDKILLYSTTREPLGNTINLCFFADTDYDGNWRSFLADTEKLIYQGYHSNNKVVSNKEKWTFFYTQQECDGLALAQDPFNPDRYPAMMKDSIIHGIDAYGLLHSQPYSDGAYLNANIQFLAQNVFTAEGYNLGTAVHETAHAVFHLSDEYSGCVCFTSLGGSNIFEQLTDCQNFNRAEGISPNDCTELQGYDSKSWYLPEKPPFFNTIEQCRTYNISQGLPADSCRRFIDLSGTQSYQAFKGNCIMNDDGDRVVPDFRYACGSVIDRYYEKLQPGPSEPVSMVLSEKVDNMFGYEPVVLLDLNVQQEQVGVDVQKVCYGIPAKNIIGREDFNLAFSGTRKSPHEVPLDRPDCVHIHYGNNQFDVKTTKRQVSCKVSVPAMEGLSEVRSEDNRGKKSATKVFSIKNEVREKVQNFEMKH